MIYNLKEKMNIAIILAAGTSKRLAGKTPKQFRKINNKLSILEMSVNTFRKNKLIKEIIIVVQKNWVSKIKEKFKDCTIVIGGNTRSISSYNGLNECSNKCKNVLIHDAARPFVTQEIINKCIKKLDNYHAVIPMIDCSDSLLIKEIKEINYLDRDKIKLIQTPQGFNYKKIISAYKNNIVGTDDFSVLLKSGGKIKSIFIKSTKSNFKITCESDLKIARKISE